jgi:hypothetical protein
MKAERKVYGGAFDAEGTTIEPAEIHVSFVELSLDEFKDVSTKLTKFFKIDPPEILQRRFQKIVILEDNHQIHDGGNPVEGRHDLIC